MNTKFVRFLKKIKAAIIDAYKKVHGDHADGVYASVVGTFVAMICVWLVGKVMIWTNLVKFLPVVLEKNPLAVGVFTTVLVFFVAAIVFVAIATFVVLKKLWDES